MSRRRGGVSRNDIKRIRELGAIDRCTGRKANLNHLCQTSCYIYHIFNIAQILIVI